MTKFFTTVRRSIAIAAIAAAGGALVSTPAFADADKVVSTRTVSFADLDLSTSAGQARMQTRMHAAARQVCGYNPTVRDLDERADQNTCIALAMNGAQTSLAMATSKSNSGQQVAISDVTHRNVPGNAR